jgi:hypothetical protein
MKRLEPPAAVTALLICGILAPLLHVGTDVLAGRRWRGYSFISQSISELSAIGAPTRPLVVSLDLVSGVLLIAFGLGVSQMAGGRRALRVTGGLLAGNAAIALVVTAFFPMQLGEAVSSPANVANTALMATGVVLFLLAMGFGAAARRGWFRTYSVGMLLTYLALTVWGLWRSPPVVAGQRLPTVGIQERTMVYAYLLWVAVLAVALVRARRGLDSTGGGAA